MPLSIKNRGDLGRWLNSAGLTGMGVEVGVAEGNNAAVILRHWKGFLYLVDPYRTWPKDDYLDTFNNFDQDKQDKQVIIAKTKLAGYPNRAFMFSDSLQAASQFEDNSLDFCYIDANHAYEAASADIAAWWPKVKPGGLFSGHDYLDFDGPCHGLARYVCGVKRAVDEFLARTKLELTNTPCSSWYVIKPLPKP